MPNERIRYEIRRGRFGLYFYDTIDCRDVDLYEALDKMNAYNNIHSKK